MTQRITFILPAVEPEHPPIKYKRKSQNCADVGQVIKSAVANPVVDIIDIT